MSQLESHRPDQPVIDQAAVQSMVKYSVKDLEKRLEYVEARPSANNSVTNESDEERAKERKKILKALVSSPKIPASRDVATDQHIQDQLRTFMCRIENREKHEREIDMSETRERLHELWEVLGRSENDGQGKYSHYVPSEIR